MPVPGVNLKRKSYFDVWGTNIICTALCTEALITCEARRTHMSFAETLFRRKLTAYAAGRSELMEKMWMSAKVTKCFKTFCHSNAKRTVMLRKLRAGALRWFKNSRTLNIRNQIRRTNMEVQWTKCVLNFSVSAIVGLFQINRQNGRNNKE